MNGEISKTVVLVVIVGLIGLTGCTRTTYPNPEYRASYSFPEQRRGLMIDPDYDRYPYYDYRHYPEASRQGSARYGSFTGEQLDTEAEVSYGEYGR